MRKWFRIPPALCTDVRVWVYPATPDHGDRHLAEGTALEFDRTKTAAEIKTEPRFWEVCPIAEYRVADHNGHWEICNSHRGPQRVVSIYVKRDWFFRTCYAMKRWAPYFRTVFREDLQKLAQRILNIKLVRWLVK
jgi:hypothetical protein